MPQLFYSYTNNYAERYWFGFQGQEAEDELYGEGNASFYKYGISDNRLGRFFAIDPLAPEYPHNSPYAFSENRVIDGVELEGLEYESIHDDDGNIIDYKYVGYDFVSPSGEFVPKEGSVSSFNLSGEGYSITGTSDPNTGTGSVTGTFYNKESGAASVTQEYGYNEMSQSVDATFLYDGVVRGGEGGVVETPATFVGTYSSSSFSSGNIGGSIYGGITNSLSQAYSNSRMGAYPIGGYPRIYGGGITPVMSPVDYLLGGGAAKSTLKLLGYTIQLSTQNVHGVYDHANKAVFKNNLLRHPETGRYLSGFRTTSGFRFQVHSHTYKGTWMRHINIGKNGRKHIPF